MYPFCLSFITIFNITIYSETSFADFHQTNTLKESDESRDSLKAILLNSREIENVHHYYKLPYFKDQPDDLQFLKSWIDLNWQGFGWSGLYTQKLFEQVTKERLLEDSRLCTFFDLGCLMVSYLDSSSFIHPLNIEGRSARGNMGGQLEVQLFLKLEEKYYSKGLEYNYLKSFKRQWYFRVEDRVKHDRELLSKLYTDFINDQVDSAKFTSTVAKLPRSFADLPNLYNKATRSASLDKVKTIKNTYLYLLLLTHDALTEASNSDLDTYNHRDRLMPPGVVLTLNELLRKWNITSIENVLWPRFEDLNHEARSAAKGVFLSRDKHNRIWQAKGAYDAFQNKLWIDFQEPFFENIFVLHHELWHFAWSHSTAHNTEVRQFLTSMRENRHNAEELKRTLQVLISKNEYLAIQQQSLLFHAIRFLVAQWNKPDEREYRFTRPWYDTYFGDEASANIVPNSSRKRGNQTVWDVALFAPSALINTALTLEYYSNKFKHSGFNKYNSWLGDLAQSATSLSVISGCFFRTSFHISTNSGPYPD